MAANSEDCSAVLLVVSTVEMLVGEMAAGTDLSTAAMRVEETAAETVAKKEPTWAACSAGERAALMVAWMGDLWAALWDALLAASTVSLGVVGREFSLVAVLAVSSVSSRAVLLAVLTA